MDYLIARLGTDENSSQTESKYQYQRAYALSRELKDQILDYSNTQLQQLQNSSVLVYIQFSVSQLSCLLTTSSVPGNVQPRLRRTSKMPRPHRSSPPRQKLAFSVILWFPSFKRFRLAHLFDLLSSSDLPVGCDGCSSLEPSGLVQARARRDCKHDFRLD